MGKTAINATHYEDLPAFPSAIKQPANVVNAIIETPKGAPHKYALKNEYGIIAFNEVLPDSMQWPFDYGFVPGTLADDGDPLDILVITQNGLFSGCLIEARIVGSIVETKDKVENDRLIAVPLPSPGAPQVTDSYREIDDLPRALLEHIKRFLKEYSQRQGHSIEIKSVAGSRHARRSVKRAVRAFKKRH